MVHCIFSWFSSSSHKRICIEPPAPPDIKGLTNCEKSKSGKEKKVGIRGEVWVQKMKDDWNPLKDLRILIQFLSRSPPSFSCFIAFIYAFYGATKDLAFQKRIRDRTQKSSRHPQVFRTQKLRRRKVLSGILFNEITLNDDHDYRWRTKMKDERSVERLG